VPSKAADEAFSDEDCEPAVIGLSAGIAFRIKLEGKGIRAVDVAG